MATTTEPAGTIATTEERPTRARHRHRRGLGPRLHSWFDARRARPVDTAVRLLVLAGAIYQLVALLGLSNAQWGDYALTRDYTLFEQAWWLLGHGHLDPFSTVAGHPFWQDQFNLTFWPLGLLYLVSHSSMTLLVVQDVVMALASLVAGLWVWDVASARVGKRPVTAVAIVVGLMVVLNVDPWVLETAHFDFHLETFAALFLLLCGRSLWRRRRASPYVWALLGLASCTAAAVLTVGFGLGVCLVARDLRRKGLVIAALGLVFAGIVVALDANQGTPLATNYGYLAGTHHVGSGLSGALTIAGNVVAHPSLPWSVLWSKRGDLATIFTTTGILGVFSGWGIGIAIVDVLATALNVNSSYVVFQSGGFQNYPAIMILLVSAAITIVWLIENGSRLFGRLTARIDPRWTGVAGRMLGAAGLASCLVVAADQDGGIPHQWLSVWAPGAHTIAGLLSQAPSDEEVVVSQGFAGRFGDRQYVYVYMSPGQSVPLETKQVLFVLSPLVGILTVEPSTTTAAVNALVNRYHGRVVASTDDVWGIVVQRSAVPGHVVELPPS